MPHWSDLLQRPRSPTLTSALVGALLLALRFWLRKRAPVTLPFGTENTARRIRGPGEEYDFDEYDVIVVGGGNAGCVVASRLSEDPSIRVCLLEAGESSAKNPFAIIPASYSRLMHTKHEWETFTVPQTDADSEIRYWPRAKLLGGCTCINALIFHNCAPEDYDEWARIQKGQEGAEQWSFKEMDPYIQKFERYVPNPEYPDVDISLRGQSGPVQTGLWGYTSPSTFNFIEACRVVGIPPVADLNTRNGTLGVSKVMTYVTPGGRRVTSEYAYLTPEVLARPNLKVITQAHVRRVLFDQSGETPRAVGAEFSQPNGDVFQVKARKEVVLSAGAVHTPHILMLSGIGPADHLTAHNIPVVADLPGVGAHLLDHPVIDFNFLDKSESSIMRLHSPKFMDKLTLLREVLYYQMTGKGKLTGNMAEVIAFARATDPKLFPPEEFPPEEVEDVCSGPGAPDFELFCTPAGYLKHGMVRLVPGHYFALHAILLRPKSQGTIRLKSNNPYDAPVIDPKYLSAPNDLTILMRAARLLGRLAQTAPLAAMRDPAGDRDRTLDHGFATLDDDALAALVRRKVETIYHPTSSARMAPRADGGVLDPYLRVHGVPNLRVVDASAFPNITSGHTSAPAFALGEKASDLIKAALSSKA